MTDKKKQEYRLPHALTIYETNDFATQQKARFIFYMIIAGLIAMVLIVSSSIYLQLIRTDFKELYLPVIMIETAIMLLFGVSLLLLIKGYYALSTHLILSLGIISIWIIMWIDKGHFLTRLDTIILIVALLNLSPLFITKFKTTIFIYISANIVLLVTFMFFWAKRMHLPLDATIDYIVDSSLAMVFTGILGYNIFIINKKTIDKATEEIKERKRSEEILKENELFRSRVFDSSRIAIVVMDGLTYEFIDCNPAAVEMYQFPSREHTLHKTPIDVSAPIQYDGTPSNQKVLFYIQKASRDGNIVFDWLHQRPNGDLWDAEVHLMSFESGGRKLFQFSLIDITERKKAENLLKESEEKYRFLLENMNEVVMKVDNDDRVLFVNKKFTELLGYSADEIIGKIGFKILLDPEDYDTIIEENIKRIQKKNTQYEISLKAKGGNKINFLVNGSPIVDGNGKTVGSIGTMTDITDRKTVELELEKYRNHLESLVKERTEELAATNEELSATNEELYGQKEELHTSLTKLNETQNRLIQSEKMASLGVLSAGIAHEINNPLNFIQGGALGMENYILEYFKDHHQNIEFYLNAIKTGVNRAAEIVTSLNHYSRQDDLPRNDCNMHDIINNCLIMLHSQLKNKVEIHKLYTTEPHAVKGNEGKLHQAILNILSNAEQSIQEKGVIEIKTNVFNTHLTIEISDSGCGIDQANIQKVFDPFFTTKSPGQGTGLGLSITYKIIQEHGGTIEIESLHGQGTKVIVHMPIKQIN